MKKILVVLGHPGPESLCRTLADDYRRGAEAAGATVSVLDVGALRFQPDLESLHGGELEPDLVRAQDAVRAADHIVFVHPNWWGTYPARLKAFLDRTLLPGFAFRYRGESPAAEPLLKGKTSRLVVTMDGPGWWYRWFMGNGGDRALRHSVLAFCGIRTLGAYHADNLRPRTRANVEGHRRKVERWGRRDGTKSA